MVQKLTRHEEVRFEQFEQFHRLLVQASDFKLLYLIDLFLCIIHSLKINSFFFRFHKVYLHSSSIFAFWREFGSLWEQWWSYGLIYGQESLPKWWAVRKNKMPYKHARGNRFFFWYLSRKLQMQVKTYWRSSDFPNAFSQRIANFQGLILGVPARKTVDIISRELTCLAAEISRLMKQAESFLVQRMQLLSPWQCFDLNTSRAILSASAASDKIAQQTNSPQEHLASFETKLVSGYFKPREDFIQISF